jgi:hypothetical protein
MNNKADSRSLRNLYYYKKNLDNLQNVLVPLSKKKTKITKKKLKSKCNSFNTKIIYIKYMHLILLYLLGIIISNPSNIHPYTRLYQLDELKKYILFIIIYIFNISL